MFAEKRSQKSTNPVLARWKFTRAGSVENERETTHTLATVGATPPAQAPISLLKMADHADATGAFAGSQVTDRVMTMDDVVVRTAATLGTAALTAVLSWLLLPVDPSMLGDSYGIAAGAALVALVVAMAQIFKRRPSPLLILTYAAFEGLFLGVFSNAASAHIAPGVVIQAVLGTMAVFAGVLIGYKLRWIRVTRRFHGFVLAAGTGFALLTVANLLFSAFTEGDGLGFRSGGLGVVFGVVGVVLAAAFLGLHFKEVEDGVSYGAPREESWRAAFGLVLTLVWLYVEILNLLTLLNQDDVY